MFQLIYPIPRRPAGSIILDRFRMLKTLPLNYLPKLRLTPGALTCLQSALETMIIQKKMPVSGSMTIHLWRSMETVYQELSMPPGSGQLINQLCWKSNMIMSMKIIQAFRLMNLVIYQLRSTMLNPGLWVISGQQPVLLVGGRLLPDSMSGQLQNIIRRTFIGMNSNWF